MITMLDFAILAIATMFAVAASAALSWMFLRAAFALMHPATRRIPSRTELVRGTAQLARAYAGIAERGGGAGNWPTVQQGFPDQRERRSGGPIHRSEPGIEWKGVTRCWL